MLPITALERGVQEVPLGSAPLRRMMRKLEQGEHIVVTALGMSNTFDFAGCFGLAGCHSSNFWRKEEGRGSDQGSRGWGFDFMNWVNKTWPHPGHQFYNHAAGASNPSFATNCLASHLAPETDMLIVDFDLSGWSMAKQVLAHDSMESSKLALTARC